MRKNLSKEDTLKKIEMMKKRNAICSVLYVCILVCLYSCKDKGDTFLAIEEKSYKESNPLVLKLEILENTVHRQPDYFIDSTGKSTVLITTKYGIDSVFFEGEEGLREAIAYGESHNLSQRLVKRTVISLLNHLQQPEDRWLMDEKIAIEQREGINVYARPESKLFVEDSFIREAGIVKNGLTIGYTEKGLDGGFKTSKLNFVNESNQLWRLVSKERINTLYSDLNQEKRGYCIDTLLRHQKKVFEKGEQIWITNEMLF